jgi:hypothetical protein
MQHANRLDSGSRTAPSPTPLPTPPDSATQSPFDRRTMSPVEGRPSPYRKASRGSSSAGIRSASDDTKLFMFESDASTDKYMHYYDQLSDRLDVPRPTAVEHQVKHDPSGTLKSICSILALLTNSMGIRTPQTDVASSQRDCQVPRYIPENQMGQGKWICTDYQYRKGLVDSKSQDGALIPSTHLTQLV